MKGKVKFITVFLFCAAWYGFLPDISHATSDAQLISIKDKHGTEVSIYNESHALVIGGSDYTGGWPKLPGVEKDILLVKDALEKKGFNVVLVQNPDSQGLENAFERFIEKYGYKPNNRLLFYFAGHGHTVKPQYGGEPLGYIVPVEAPNPFYELKKFRRVAMSMQRIEEYALSIDAKHALFVFDSCFSGSLFSLSRAIPEHISYKTAKPVRQFITSGSADEEVPDTSIFRQQFISALAGEGDLNGDGYMTAAELSDFIFRNVVNYSKGAQHPQYGKIRNPHLDKGDFVFRMPQLVSVKTDVSDSSYIEHERQRLFEEKERLERVRKELEELKVLAIQRQKIETEEANLASQKDQLESKSSSDSSSNQMLVAKIQEKQAQLIHDLLSKARILFVTDKIDSPPDENALVYISKVKDIDPANKEADRLLHKIIDRYVGIGGTAFNDGRIQEAQNFEKKATNIKLVYGINNENLVSFQKQIHGTKTQEPKKKKEKVWGTF
jgi:hypothetical protein